MPQRTEGEGGKRGEGGEGELAHVLSGAAAASYNVEYKLGEGGYSVVWAARRKADGRPVVIKCISQPFRCSLDARRALREVMYQQQLSHACLLPLLEVWRDERESDEALYLVLPRLYATLYDALREGWLTAPTQRVLLSFQLLCGLAYLHARGLVHRDVKPLNLLVSAHCRLMLCDFGLVRSCAQIGSPSEIGASPVGCASAPMHSRPRVGSFATRCLAIESPETAAPDVGPAEKASPFEISPPAAEIAAPATELPELTGHAGSRWYRAPELLFGSVRYGTQADLWSAGCVLAELLSSKVLLPGSSDVNQCVRIFELSGWPSAEEIDSFGSGEAGREMLALLPRVRPARRPLHKLVPRAPEQGLHLIGALLRLKPSERVDAGAALHHPWFSHLMKVKLDGHASDMS